MELKANSPPPMEKYWRRLSAASRSDFSSPQLFRRWISCTKLKRWGVISSRLLKQLWGC